MLDFSRTDFNGAISLNPKLQIEEKVQAVVNSGYQMKNIDKVLTLEYGISLPKKKRISGDFPVYGSNGVVGSHNEFLIKAPCIIVGRKGSAGEVNWSDKDCTPIDTTFYVKLLDEAAIDLKFTYHMLKSLNLPSLKAGSGPGGINRNNIYGLQIPVPPIEVQQQIVNECEAVDQETDQARQIISTTQPMINEKVQAVINAGYEIKKIGDVYNTSSGGTPLRSKKEYYENGTIPWINSGEVSKKEINFADNFITELGLNNSNAKLFPKGTVLLAMYGATAGKVALLNIKASTNQALCALLPTKEMVPKFLVLVIESIYRYLLKIRTGIARDNLSQEKIRNIKIPVPPLNVQQQLVSEVGQLEAEITQAQAVIDKATELKNAILTNYL